MTGVVILAAGSSSRLGKPKQNLIFRGQTLLQNAVQHVLDSDCENVVVVLGANADVIRPTLIGQQIPVIYNPGWQEGMASSIRSGLTELLKINPSLDAIILMLCDQPFADAPLLNQLIQRRLTSKKNIIASAYSNTQGPPVLFDRIYFEELLQLTGNEGAKILLNKYTDKVIGVSFLLGEIDVDTAGDYEKLENEF